MDAQKPKRKKLWYKKETDNKFRWDVDVVGALLELYIPKWRVPTPRPSEVEIELSAVDACPAALSPLTVTMVQGDPSLKSRPIVALLEAGSTHTQTIRYNSVNRPETEVSHVYIPFALTFDAAPVLLLTVRWG